MKVVLVNLPWKKGKFWGVRAGSRWPHIKSPQEKSYFPFPFFLAYSASLLKQEGFEVKLIDALAEEIPSPVFLKTVLKEKPDLLVAETSTPSLNNDLEILSKLPKGIPVALCGPEANIRNADFLAKNEFIDYILVGEYEYTLLELVKNLENNKPLDNTLGLIYRDKEKTKINPLRPLIEDLDSLPFPLREGLPMEKYNDNPGGIPAPSVQMWASRGCPYQCLFCLWPQLMYRQGRYRTRNIVKVVDEMEHMVRNMGFKSVYFDDDTANIGKLRMLEFAKEIKRRKIDVPWAMMARPDLMDKEILESLQSAGLYAVKYGVESSNQNLLDKINKNMDIRQTERIIGITKSLGIKTHLTFTFGLPGETAETIKKTIDFAVGLDPDSVQFSITTAFPGTKYFDDLDEKGHIVSRQFSDYDGNSASILRTDLLSAEDLVNARLKAQKTWQFHVWQKRHGHLNSGYYFKSFLSHLKDNGPAFAFRRAFLFLGYKLTKIRESDFSKLKSQIKSQGIKPAYRKINNYFLELLGVFHGSFAFKGPECAQIDLTDNCNNNCIGCWCNSPLLKDKAYKGTKKYKTLPTPLVKELIEELSGLGTRQLYFSGGGEPFMHPDIMEILDFAKQKMMHCSVNTNFTLANEFTIKKLIDLKLDYLTVSVWAGKAATYAATHPNKDESAFYRIESLLTMLNTLKQDSKPYVKVYNVISNLNFSELKQMVEFAEETASDAVEFTVIDTIPGATDALVLSAQQRRSVLEQCAEIKKEDHGVKILNLEHFMRRLTDSNAGKAEYDSEFIETMPCYIGWLFARVMANGDVNSCLKSHRIPVGSLYEKKFREIWNSEKQIEFRQKALKMRKNDPYFALIGNDPDCKIGCYKSCDDIGRNLNMHERIKALSFLERKFLDAISRLKAKPV